MTAAPVALLVLALALLVWPPPSRAVRRLAAGVPPGPTTGPTTGPTGPEAPGPLRRRVLAGCAGLAAAALLGGGVLALGVGIGVGIGLERWLARAGPAPADDPSRWRADLPVACDLLAVCLSGGTPVGAAVGAVGSALGGPLGACLAGVAGAYRLGAAPRQAWAEVPAVVAPLARTVVRAGDSGSSVVPALHRLAADSRITERAATATAVQRAGVWVLAPLGLCFLPAFLCLGVAPLVLGIAADVFG